MKAKILIVLVVATAVLVAALRLLPGGPSSEPDGAVRRGAPSTASAQDDGLPGDLVDAEDGVSSPGRQGGRTSALTQGRGAASKGAGDPKDGGGALTVRIQWPTGAAPAEGLEVYGFVERISTPSLIRALTKDPEADAFMRSRASLFDVLADEDTGDGQGLLERPAAVAPVVNGPDGSTATLNLAGGRERVMIYAVGAGFATEESVEALVARGEVTVAVEQLGRVLIDATAQDSGGAVAGAFIELVEDRPVDMQPNAPGGDFRARAMLDAEGHAELDLVPCGQALRVRVLSDDFCALELSIPPLTPGEERAVAVQMSTGIQVTGRAVDEEGKGVGAATVKAFLPGKAFGFDDTLIRETETEDNGSFTLALVPEGRLVLRADKDGYLESARQLLTVRSNDAAEDLVLERGRSITGRVLPTGAVAVSDLTVKATFDLSHMAGVGALGATRGASAEAVTGPDGAFTIRGLGAGPFTLRVSTESAGGESQAFTARADGVRPGKALIELTLRPELYLEGVALDDLGEPITGEEVLASRIVSGALGDVRLDRLRALTDENGAFLIEGITEGEWALSLTTELHVTPEELSVEVQAPVKNLQLVALRAARVDGMVLDPTGSPAANVSVSQSFDEPSWRVAISRKATPEKTRSLEDGTFTLLGLIPGEVSLSATSDHLAPGQTDVLSLAPGEHLKGVTLRMSQGGTIEGVVFDDEGKTATGRMITVQSMSMEMMRTTTSGSDGTFKEEGLTPGRYQVIAMDPEMDLSGDLEGAGMAAMFESMKMAMVSVDEAETKFVFLGAPPAAPVDVSGRVTLGGEPLTGAMIAWMPAAVGMYDKMKLGTIEEDGGYALTLDDAGDYIVNVTRLGTGGTGQQQTIEFSVNVPLRSTELSRDFALPGGRIAGRVLLENGSPANGERVTVTGIGAVRTDRLLGDGYAEVATDSEGGFEAVGLRPGTYQVMAGGATPMSQATATYSRIISDPIQLGKDENRDNVTLTLSEPGSIRFMVKDADGSPAKGASVFLRDDKGRHTELLSLLITSASGEVVASGIAPGTYTAGARARQDASLESAPITVRSGETTDATLTLGPGSVLVITIKGKGDEALKAASVEVLDRDGFDVTRRLGLTDVQKKFENAVFAVNERRVGPLPPGRYTVIGTSADGRKGKRRVTLTGGDEKQLTLLLK